PQLAGGLERHRQDIDAFVGKEPADTRERARGVRQAERELDSNHEQSVSLGGGRCGLEAEAGRPSRKYPAGPVTSRSWQTNRRLDPAGRRERPYASTLITTR